VRRERLCDVFDAMDQSGHASVEDEVPDCVVELRVWAGEQVQALFGAIQAGFKNLDRRFWSHMVVVHERRVVRKAAFRASIKKKSLACLDAFLALIMK